MRPDPESPKCYGNLSRYGSCVCSNATMTDINVTPQRLSMKARWPRKRSRENERGLHLRRPYSFLKVSAVNRNR
jgi:hypothetical protein